MSLVNTILHLLLGFIELACFLFGAYFADNLFKKPGDIQTRPAFVAFHMQFDLAAFADDDFKFALWHN
jgi:hypothetical protein